MTPRPSARAKTPHMPMPAVVVNALELSALRAEARATLERIMHERSAPVLQGLIELLESRETC